MNEKDPTIKFFALLFFAFSGTAFAQGSCPQVLSEKMQVRDLETVQLNFGTLTIDKGQRCSKMISSTYKVGTVEKKLECQVCSSSLMSKTQDLGVQKVLKAEVNTLGMDPAQTRPQIHYKIGLQGKNNILMALNCANDGREEIKSAKILLETLQRSQIQCETLEAGQAKAPVPSRNPTRFKRTTN